MARNMKNTSPLIRTRLKKMHLTDKTGELVATDIEKVKVLNFFFASFQGQALFPHLSCSHTSRQEIVREDQVQRNLNIHDSKGHDKKHPSVLKETGRPLLSHSPPYLESQSKQAKSITLQEREVSYPFLKRNKEKYYSLKK